MPPVHLCLLWFTRKFIFLLFIQSNPTMATQREKNQEEINQVILKVKRRGRHAQTICFEMSGTKTRIHTFHYELALIILKTHAALNRYDNFGKPIKKLNKIISSLAILFQT